MTMNKKSAAGPRLTRLEAGFEPGYLADFISVLGAEKAIHWMDHLGGLLAVTFSNDNQDPNKLKDTAHAMISQAGTLGFVELARRSAKLEEAILANGSYLDELQDVQKEAHRVCDALTRLKTEIALGEHF